MTSIFVDSQEVIVIDYIEHGQSINGAYNISELTRLCQEIAR